MITYFPLLIICIFVITACTLRSPRINSSGLPQREYTYQIPEKIADGWETSSLEEKSVNSEKIVELIEDILNKKYKNVHSVLLVANGKLILEEYFYEFHHERPHQLRSATKSISSILTGIAIDQGLIRDVTERTYPYLKSYEPPKGWDIKVRDVTIKSILTMTSGYDCDDFRTGQLCEKNMTNSYDWLTYAVNLPMAHEPGTYWAYNSVTPQLIEKIISERSGMSLPEFSNKYLFEPLGITDFQWFLTPKGRAYISGWARMRPRDMAKIGYLALNKGKWKNTQIVSEQWISESTKEHTSPPVHSLLAKTPLETCGYGYLWWTKDFSIHKENIQSFFAMGNGGQMIFVFPRLDLVAVFTQGNYDNSLGTQPFEMLNDYIIPAKLSKSPVHKN
jgi:CubicO group peptidase (beta-lactamase class C family)